MGNKEDWEEIEKSVRKAEQRRLASHKGFDYTEKLNKISKKSKTKIFSKLSKKVFKRIIIMFSIIAIPIIFIVARDYLYQIRHSHNIDVKHDIESTKYIEINQISATLDEKGNIRRILF